MATEWEHIHLRNFSEAELMFDEQETKEILKFFFQADRQQIESIEVTNELRNFAQGLLVAAVDASYAMGWVDIVRTWSANPGQGMKRALQKLALRAARYWFKHLKNRPLNEAKIYDSVRKELARRFKSHFVISFQAKAQGTRRHPLIAVVNCGAPQPHDRVWG